MTTRFRAVGSKSSLIFSFVWTILKPLDICRSNSHLFAAITWLQSYNRKCSAAPAKPGRQGRWLGLLAQATFLVAFISQEQFGWSVFPEPHYFMSHNLDRPKVHADIFITIFTY